MRWGQRGLHWKESLNWGTEELVDKILRIFYLLIYIYIYLYTWKRWDNDDDKNLLNEAIMS